MSNKNIELLNRSVAEELSAINQYMYFHFHCSDQGLSQLADLFKKTAMKEMQHLEKLAERILFLKGDVNMEPSSHPKKVKDVKEMLELARQMEADGVKEYNTCVAKCAANSDSVSKQLFESLIVDEESHFQFFDLQLENIKKFGDNYLALQSIEKEIKG